MNSTLIKSGFAAIGAFWNDTVYKVDHLLGGHISDSATFSQDEV